MLQYLVRLRLWEKQRTASIISMTVRSSARAFRFFRCSATLSSPRSIGCSFRIGGTGFWASWSAQTPALERLKQAALGILQCSGAYHPRCTCGPHSCCRWLVYLHCVWPVPRFLLSRRSRCGRQLWYATLSDSTECIAQRLKLLLQG